MDGKKDIKTCYSIYFMQKLKIFELLARQTRHNIRKTFDNKCDQLTLIIETTRDHQSKMDS